MRRTQHTRKRVINQERSQALPLKADEKEALVYGDESSKGASKLLSMVISSPRMISMISSCNDYEMTTAWNEPVTATKKKTTKALCILSSEANINYVEMRSYNSWA